MNLLLRIWRQRDHGDPGAFMDWPVRDASPGISLLELLDQVNEELVVRGEEPVAFDSDCREGICGACSLVINGIPHGGEKGATACQLHLRSFADGATLVLEPWRARAFPVVRDLIVDRRAMDRIVQAGGYVSVGTGGAPDANSLPVARRDSERAMDAAQCIGCGACVAACRNASAMLFVAAKISHLALLPQGQAERRDRAVRMVEAMDAEGFGACTVTGSCEAVCPKEISLDCIARMNREYGRALLR